MWFQQTEWHYFFVLKHIDIFTTSLCLDCPTKHCTCELTSVHATNINFLLFLLIFLSQFINHSNLVLKLVISHFGDFQIMRPGSDICHAMPRHSERHSLTPCCQSWQTKTKFAHILSEFSITCIIESTRRHGSPYISIIGEAWNTHAGHLLIIVHIVSYSNISCANSFLIKKNSCKQINWNLSVWFGH